MVARVASVVMRATDTGLAHPRLLPGDADPPANPGVEVGAALRAGHRRKI
jgi:hypothetical protein